MINYREILRLLDLGYTQREVSRSLHCSRNTVRDVLYLSKELNIRWPLDDNVTNSELAGLFHPKQEGTDFLWLQIHLTTWLHLPLPHTSSRSRSHAGYSIHI